MSTCKVLSCSVIVAVAGCTPKVASIDLSPDSLSFVKKGEARSLSASAKDAEKRNVENAVIVFTSTDPAVATVNAGGKVTAVMSGDTTIVATVDKVAASAPVKVSIPASISLAPSDIKLTGAGSKALVVAKVLDEKAREVQVDLVWESADVKVATVAKGEIVSVGVGETTVFAAIGVVRAPVKVAVSSAKCVQLSLDGKTLVVSMYNKGNAQVEDFLRQDFCKGAVGNLLVTRYNFNSAYACIVSKVLKGLDEKGLGDGVQCNWELVRKMKEQNGRIRIWAKRCNAKLEEESCD